MCLVGILYGLPIEQVLTNKGVKRKEMTVAEYRENVKSMPYHKSINNVTILNV